MNPALRKLQPYPFERLAAIRNSVLAPLSLAPIDLSIGEPKHPAPAFIAKELQARLGGLNNYPTTAGIGELRQAIARWLVQRFRLPADAIDPDANVLPVNGTREALFAITQCVVDAGHDSAPIVLIPNPFYQIYEGAAVLAGAQPWYVNPRSAVDYRADFAAVPATVLERCQLCYVCSPANPGGAVMNTADFKWLLDLADRYDFVVASDECYSELYYDDSRAPIGLLQAAIEQGRHDFRRCIVFHSLSKRSNVPGLRSGCVSGDAKLIEQFLRYRTYHGCAMPLPTQYASIAAWQDEKHVADNRRLYREKFTAVIDILSSVLEVREPEGGFYLWPEVPMDDVDYARLLYREKNVSVLPGTFLARDPSSGTNPGRNRVRIALVAPFDECLEAAHRIVDLMQNHKEIKK